MRRIGPIRPICSPGTTISAETCRGGLAPAFGPIPTMSGSARSCCSRRRWRPSGPILTDSLARWPDISALAAAPLDAILHMWQGLGYYARARNLHACAAAVVERHGGVFPSEPAALRALPGHRRLHRGGDRGDRLRPSGGGGRRQCRARRRSALRHRPAAGLGKAEAEGARRGLGPGVAGRRLRPGDDGSRRHDLHPAPAALRAVPVARRVPRGGERAGGKIADARRQSRNVRGVTASPSG